MLGETEQDFREVSTNLILGPIENRAPHVLLLQSEVIRGYQFNQGVLRQSAKRRCFYRVQGVLTDKGEAPLDER